MSEELQREILKIIKESHSFALEQAPDVVRELLGAAFLTQMFYSIVSGFAALSFLVLVAVCFVQERRQEGRFRPTGWLIGCIFSFVISFAAMIAFMDNITTCVKIKQFPKAYLVERFSGRWGK